MLGAGVAKADVGTEMNETEFLFAKEWVIWLEWGDRCMHDTAEGNE